MTRRLVLALAGLAAAAGGLTAAEPRKPNAIVIVADALEGVGGGADFTRS